MNEEVHVESSGRTGRRLGKVVVAMGDLVRHRELCLENKQGEVEVGSKGGSRETR